MALADAHAPEPDDERIHHSDCGVQYCSTEYVNVLKSEGIAVSMAEANPYENAIAERINGILEAEFLLDRTLADHAQATRAVGEAVDAYNRLRPHRSIGMEIPARRYERGRDPEANRIAA